MSVRLRSVVAELVAVSDQLARVEAAIGIVSRKERDEIRAVERSYVGPLRELRAQERSLLRRMDDATREVRAALREEEER